MRSFIVLRRSAFGYAPPAIQDDSDGIHSELMNRLANETSPYLLQHAHNPVDWYPWGDEAFAKARAEDKPVFLSIGYSACHWCHVMERESFENEATADVLNEHFVSIKVDREERPDVDSIYMEAVQMMTGHGGWPMSMFLTPAGAPFYAGTYFPPDDRHGMPGFRRVLEHVAHTYRDRRGDVDAASAEVIRGISTVKFQGGGTLEHDELDRAAARIAQSYDAVNGGFGGAPKFPPSMTLDFLMQSACPTNDRALDGIIVNTLTNMACGGMYRRIGGGFHPYSPHSPRLPPPASPAGSARVRRARACIPPAPPRRNAQPARAPGRAPARAPPPDPHSAPAHARSSG